MKRMRADPDLRRFGDGCERERGVGGTLREVRLISSGVFMEINKARRRKGGIH